MKTIGAGVVGVSAIGSASADKGNNYGNGNGHGAFLDEESKWNNDPWDNEVTDKTGQSTVDVTVGAFTTINPFGGEGEEAPFGFDPQAVKVSPGTEVTWTWGVPIHHSVTSYNPEAGDPEDPMTTGDHGELFNEHSHELGHSFSHTFEEGGTYLYFCHPHGTPYPAYDGFLETIPGMDPVQENLLGMRGAVLVPGR